MVLDTGTRTGGRVYLLNMTVVELESRRNGTQFVFHVRGLKHVVGRPSLCSKDSAWTGCLIVICWLAGWMFECEFTLFVVSYRAKVNVNYLFVKDNNQKCKQNTGVFVATVIERESDET